MRSLHSRLRTVDVARACGYSVQQIRDLERVGVLPPARRGTAGHRIFERAHVDSALAYRALATALGPVDARVILRAVHTRPVAEVLALLDAAHTGLHAERVAVEQAQRAARVIAAEPLDDSAVSDAMSVAELADALGVRASTLRHWDAEGLVRPGRVDGRRRYGPADIRDARIVHQLRLAGYRVPQVRELVPDLRSGADAVAHGLAARELSVRTRSRAMLSASAVLTVLIPELP